MKLKNLDSTPTVKKQQHICYVNVNSSADLDEKLMVKPV